MNKLAGYLRAMSLVVLTVSFNAAAKDLGVIGTIYPIKERSMIDHIMDLMNAKIEAGGLDELKKELVEKGKNYASRPPGRNLPRASDYTATAISPLYTLDRDIFDADGNLLFRKGTQVNPLEVMPFKRTLCFIDGDDELQVDWARKYCIGSPDRRLVLVSGDYLDTANELNQRIYFDQKGVLSERFSVTALPAVVRQSGEVLYVEQFPIK